MGALRSKWARGVVLWTLVMSVVAIALVVLASASLVDAQQRCFVEFPSVACPEGQDRLLAFAFFGVPLIWLIGLIAAIAGRAVSKRRRDRHG